MPNFPSLIPAFTAHVVIDPAISVGSVSKGAPLTVVPLSAKGFMKSESNYHTQVDAVVLHGADFIRQDPSGKHIRLDVNSVLKDKSGALITYKYNGIVKLNPGIVAVLAGHEDAKTTPFGDSFTHVLFETGSEDLRILEEKVFVASGRFVVDQDRSKPTVVEYCISEVTV